MIEWQAPYAGLVSIITFFFALFTYTLDHYFDSNKAVNQRGLHQRHIISEKGYKMALQGFALTTIVSLYFFLIRPMLPFYIGNALLLATLSGVYFLLVFKLAIPKWSKQLAGGIILALIIGSWAGIESYKDLNYWVYISFVACSVCSNLFFFGWIDDKYDEEQSPKQSPKSISKMQLVVLFAVSSTYIFVAGFLIGQGQSWFFIPFVYLAVLLLLKKEIIKRNSMRIFLDLCMLLPMLKWFWT